MKWTAGILLVFGLWFSGPVTADVTSSIQFSGHTTQSAPDGRLRKATLFVGDNRVRMEYRKDELDIVEICYLFHDRRFTCSVFCRLAR